MTEQQDLIKQIVEHELGMFLSVPTDGEDSCQKHPDLFRLHRKVQFSIWSRDTLYSYLQDLLHAQAEGMNLMTIKYARMNDLIPRTNDNTLIERIFSIQYQWQREMFQKHPKFMHGARPLSSVTDSTFETSFETYLKAELETYSDKTLSLLFKDLNNLQRREINGSEKVYKLLVKEMAYESIDDVEHSRR